jgi:hypothetical protein
MRRPVCPARISRTLGSRYACEVFDSASEYVYVAIAAILPPGCVFPSATLAKTGG